ATMGGDMPKSRKRRREPHVAGAVRIASPLGGEPCSCYWSPRPFSPGGTSMARVARVDLPQRSVLKPLYAKAGFADAFAIDLPSNATGDAERLAAHMLMGQARWVGWLIALRDTLVAGFGLKTSSELRDDVATDRLDFFLVYDRRRYELISG